MGCKNGDSHCQVQVTFQWPVAHFTGEHIFVLHLGEGTVSWECVLGHHRLISPLSPLPGFRFLGPPQSSRTESPHPVLLVGPALLTRLFSTKEMSHGLPKAFDKCFFFFLSLRRILVFYQVRTGVAKKSKQAEVSAPDSLHWKLFSPCRQTEKQRN